MLQKVCLLHIPVELRAQPHPVRVSVRDRLRQPVHRDPSHGQRQPRQQHHHVQHKTSREQEGDLLLGRSRALPQQRLVRARAISQLVRDQRIQPEQQ